MPANVEPARLSVGNVNVLVQQPAQAQQSQGLMPIPIVSFLMLSSNVLYQRLGLDIDTYVIDMNHTAWLAVDSKGKHKISCSRSLI